MPQLKVMSLNCGRLLQERTREYLKRLASGEEVVPDVLCLQDIPERDLPWLRVRWPHVAFAPMTNHLIYGVRAVVGIAILSRYPMTHVVRTTWGDRTLKDLQGVNDQNERYLGEESDRLVEATEDRVIILANIDVEGGRRREFRLATTHGMWVRGGITNDVQRKTMRRTCEILKEEGYRPRSGGGFVLVGDLNFGRGGEIHQMFEREFTFLSAGYMRSIDTTLDPDHPASKRGIKVVSDWIMTTGSDQAPMDVRLQSGVSDHQALLFTIDKP